MIVVFGIDIDGLLPPKMTVEVYAGYAVRVRNWFTRRSWVVKGPANFVVGDQEEIVASPGATSAFFRA